MTAPRHERFVETIAAGRVSGRRSVSDRHDAGRTPLIVALHGGSYTSAYFDLPGFSLLDRAAAAGMDVLAIDRPGYGETTPLAAGTETIRNSAERLDAIVGGLVARSTESERAIVLLGHSIGAAIALSIAARHPSWSLVGIAVSGMCLDSPPEAGEAWANLPDTMMVELPSALKDAVMFGPPGTFDAPMPGLSHKADAPVPRAELIDIVSGWPNFAAEILSKISVPVHYRLAEHDRLWIADVGQVARFKASLKDAARSDAALLSDTGHCTDFHHAGPALQDSQLDFVRTCAVSQ